MSAYLDKYHIGLNSAGYILSQKGGIRYYQKKKAPEFVGKFGSGDSAYRDATFWQYFVQTNWRNGAKQLKWDDPGKFWKSSDVNTSELEQLTLSNAMESAGTLGAGLKVNTMEAWRSSTSWYNSNYGYRQQITVTAPSTQQVPVGYPLNCTINTATLETAAKVRSDRRDWRIVYWNGSTWVDLTRDYVSASSTFFACQTAIPSGGTDNNYYAYYGYSAESTTKQPSTEAEWNSVYFGTTWADSNTVALYHTQEGSGSTLTDNSAQTNTGTLGTAPTWGTAGKYGRYLNFSSASKTYAYAADADTLDLSSFTLEGWVYRKTTGTSHFILSKGRDSENTRCYQFQINESGVLQMDFNDYTTKSTATVPLSTWTHVAVTYDGSNYVKFYVNGTLCGSTATGFGVLTANTKRLYIGVSQGQDGDGSEKLFGYADMYMQHLRVSNTTRSSFPYVLTTDPTITYGTELSTQPPSTSFDLYGGASDGSIYKWDGATAWVEQFNTRRITWYETGYDVDLAVGDIGGVETARSQGFQIGTSNQTVKAVQVYLKKGSGIPGDITVRIETDSTNKPSGTLAHANATTTIPAFTSTDYAWVTATFINTFSLTASTTYHLVLKTAAATNDNYYHWASDQTSPTYTSGAESYSVDGGTTWTATTARDFYFRILGDTSEVLCSLTSSLGGTQKMYFGCGNPTGQVNGDARLYSYDGTTWALVKVFGTATESMINSIMEYTTAGKVFIGTGPQAKIYSTSDFSTFTLSKDINMPQNPGYVYAMKEYNSVLFAGGGSPEFLPEQFYNGFLNTYDTTLWRILYPFDFTVIKSLEFYDAYLFMGSYHGHIYVYDTASLNPIYNLKDDYAYKVQIYAMKYFDDKLYLGLVPQINTGETNVGIWKFDRRGLSLAHTISGVEGYRCFAVVNGTLMVGTGDDGYVYKLNPNAYTTQGWYQSSYFDANLPSINKLYQSVTIKHDPLKVGETINIYYKFKEADSWTQLTTGATNDVDDEEQTLTFPAGIHSKKISLKVELNTTNTATTPKCTEVILKYTLYPARRWQWNMRLKAKKGQVLLDRTAETRTATEIRTALEGLLNTEQLYTFVDVDGTSYSVLVVDTDQNSWVINQSDVSEDEVVLSLLEA